MRNTNGAKRELRAIEELDKKAYIQDIFEEVELIFTKEKVLARNVKMYLCQRYTAKKNNGNRVAFGHQESRVAQACRRKAQKIEKDKKLKKRFLDCRGK
jgi:chromosomal replication initiation ATPase DnaA